MLRKYDKALAVFFAFCSLGLLIALVLNRDLLDWAFARHQNQLSWYIRPLFIIPFCYFAFKRSFAGIFFTLLCIFSSMFWFPEPSTVDAKVQEFLQYELNYLTGDWGIPKVLLTLIVPVSLTLLAVAFWYRNIWFGMSIMAFIAIGKIAWSIIFAGESGKSIIIPAIIGFVICLVTIKFGMKKIRGVK
ncbi:hypothetical protein SAMN05880501_107110 [Ureibacillus xyleni]|uniref:Uncharacterized protein n=1 Tax=Ureibacillus xyleni TaxID=614648 RepID=A0A285SXA5_9BACL|nr:hypothetical protein [Ureibacillus xyleni]SOC13139.1 hypothetical protein SAMN05880501_107110 [Ureibacillus xyleni]